MSQQDEINSLKAALKREKAARRSLEDEIESATRDLYNSREYLHSIINSMLDFLIVFNEEGRVVMVNEITTEALGYNSVEPLKAQKLFGDRLYVEITSEKFKAGEAMLVDSHGGVRLCLMTASKMRNPLSRENQYLCVARDFSAVRQSESYLKDRESWFSTILQSITSGVITTDNEGVITYINPSAEAFTGFSLEKALGAHLFRVLSFMGSSAIESGTLEINNFSKQSLLRQMEKLNRIRSLSGQEIDIELNGGLIKNHQDQVLGMVLVFWDVSSKKQAEEEKKQMQAQLLQSAKLASIGILSTGVAHELNNPLVAVKGYGQELAKVLPQGKEHDCSVKIVKSAERMEKIINHLRIYSRKPSDHDLKPLAINEIIATSFTLLQHDLDTLNIKIQLNLSERLPFVVGEPINLESVFQNLISNSRDAFASNRSISDKWIRITTARKSDKVVITFADNAGGMAPSTLTHLFDPFFTTKEAGKGTGLGMSITRNILKSHNGDIKAQSELGSESTFIITLPALEEVGFSQAVSEEVLPNGSEDLGPIKFESPPKILILDDDPDVLDVIVMFLEEDFEITSCSHPKEALNSIKKETYDLILTDLKMPDLTGVEVLKHAKTHQPDTPVMVMSGFARDNEMVKEALSEGAVDLLSKPFTDVEQTLAFVSKYINSVS